MLLVTKSDVSKLMQLWFCVNLILCQPDLAPTHATCCCHMNVQQFSQSLHSFEDLQTKCVYDLNSELLKLKVRAQIVRRLQK